MAVARLDRPSARPRLLHDRDREHSAAGSGRTTPPSGGRAKIWSLLWPLLAIGALAAWDLYVSKQGAPPRITYTDFYRLADAGKVASLTLRGLVVQGRFKAKETVAGTPMTEFTTMVPAQEDKDLLPLLRQRGVEIIDAVGRSRGTGLGGGNDEREQTLNQLLSEMDGFARSDLTVVLAATNRPDVLDPALLRPGRFDRRVVVDRPELEARKAILKVHTREMPLGPTSTWARSRRRRRGSRARTWPTWLTRRL